MTGNTLEFLERLGLSRYADAFEANDIDGEILAQLSDSALKDIGVASVGHRVKLLKAIVELREAQRLTPAATLPAHGQGSVDAERRQLTVMFCDLVGSTELSRRLDPEALRELMRAYQTACRTVIERYEGHVAQYLGDGLMVYFGWPHAHEDDAERALRSALEIVQAVKEIAAQPTLRVRIGVATGPVVVGETGAGDASVPKIAVGETPNLAARLQGLAAPDDIVIGATTHRLVGAAFECADLGEHALKGIVDPVHAWGVLSAARLEGRFEAAREGAGLTPLLGREEEIDILVRRWARARSGEGQVVLLGGEPGIGKSRLARALRERIEHDPHLRLRYQCSPFHTQSALYPNIEQLERAAGFAREDDMQAKLDKLERLLAQAVPEVERVAPLFASLLSLPVDRYPALNLSPQKQRDRTLEALLEQVKGLCAKRPILMVFEDAHWIDPTTQEALDLLVAAVASLPLLLLITHRPGYVPSWRGEAHVTNLTVTRLTQREGAALVARVRAGRTLPADVLEQIVAKADGIPLFLEELTKAVLESSVSETGPTPPLAIPSTLRDSLMARLDRLAPVKEIAQIGACIGREFSYELLALVAPLKDKELEEALVRLASAELIFRHGSPPDAVYTFKHALIRDAGYDSLLKARRVQLHARIARALEERFPERCETQPELVAHHFTEGALTAEAVKYWRLAGERAGRRLAYAEAIAYYQRGIELIRTLPEDADTAEQELGLQIGLGYAFIPARGYTAPQSIQAFTRAKDLCARASKNAALFRALYGLAVFNMVRGELRSADGFAQQCLEFTGHSSSSDIAVEAYLTRALTSHRLGDWLSAKTHLDRCSAKYDPIAHRDHAFVYGQDPKVCGLAWRALVLWALGYPDQALDSGREALALAGQVAHPNSQCYAYHAMWYVHGLRGEHAESLRYADLLIALARDQSFPFWAIVGEATRSLALIRRRTGGLEQVERIGEAIAAMRELGAGEPALRVQGFLTEAWADLANGAAGLPVCEEAIELSRRHDQREAEADLLRLRGDLLLLWDPGAEDDAEACYREAIAVARRQQAKSLELCAALSFARLMKRQKRHSEAVHLLRPIHGWFKEGFDTKDLVEAKALLEALA